MRDRAPQRAGLTDASPPTQPRHTAPDLAAALTRLCGVDVRVALTRNKRTYLSFRWPRGGPVVARLHQCFLDADDETVEATADFILGRGRHEARAVLRRFWRAQDIPIEPAHRRRRSAPNPLGEHFDLASLLSEVAAEVDIPPPLPSIGWGRHAHRRPRSHIRLGSYDFDAQQITIHPSLDRPDVPVAVVRQVIHHELLHHHLGIKGKRGRRVLHPPELHAMEQAFSDYAEAQAWLKAHLHLLLGRPRVARRSSP